MTGRGARVGLLVPVDNAVIEPELATTPVPGVTVHVIRLTTFERASMPHDAVHLSELFVELGVDAVGYACAETSFQDGVDTNLWLSGELARAAGVPAVTATQAMVAALAALDATRVGVATPYPAPSAAALESYLARAGMEVVGRCHRDLVSDAAGVREWSRTNLQPATTAVELARRADDPRADALLVSATNLATQPLVADLEREVAKPVVTTNAALLWWLLHAVGRPQVPEALGRLATVAPPSEGTA